MEFTAALHNGLAPHRGLGIQTIFDDRMFRIIIVQCPSVALRLMGHVLLVELKMLLDMRSHLGVLVLRGGCHNRPNARFSCTSSCLYPPALTNASINLLNMLYA